MFLYFGSYTTTCFVWHSMFNTITFFSTHNQTFFQSTATHFTTWAPFIRNPPEIRIIIIFLLMSLLCYKHTSEHVIKYVIINTICKWAKKNSYFGGHECVLHWTTLGSGRDAALHKETSTSAPVFLFRHVGIAILYPVIQNDGNKN